MPLDSTSTKVPMPHQETGAAFLAMRGFALLADEAGAGKSPQVVMAADLCQARKILMVVPAVVRLHWEIIFQEWQKIDRPIDVVEGFVKSPPGPGVTIVSHASFANEASVNTMLASAPYDVIVVDEFHFFRQFDAARTRAVLNPENGAWRWADRFWGLTGTPIVNSAADLWPMAYGPMRYGIAWYDWGVRYASEMRSDNYGGIRPIGMKNQYELADLLRPHVLRRTLAGVGVILPPLSISEVRLPVPREVLATAMADLEGWTPQRLIQAIDDKDELHDSALARVRKVLGLAKADAVATRVWNTIQYSNQPIVVFFQHTAVRERLYELLHNQYGLIVSWVDGKVSNSQLRSAVEWFQAGHLHVLLVQTDAGGIGITLTRSSHCIMAELPWTSVGMMQAYARCHRIGQTRPVIGEVMRAHDCWLEDALASAVSRKHRASETLLKLLETHQ